VDVQEVVSILFQGLSTDKCLGKGLHNKQWVHRVQKVFDIAECRIRSERNDHPRLQHCACTEGGLPCDFYVTVFFQNRGGYEIVVRYLGTYWSALVLELRDLLEGTRLSGVFKGVRPEGERCNLLQRVDGFSPFDYYLAPRCHFVINPPFSNYMCQRGAETAILAAGSNIESITLVLPPYRDFGEVFETVRQVFECSYRTSSCERRRVSFDVLPVAKNAFDRGFDVDTFSMEVIVIHACEPIRPVRFCASLSLPNWLLVAVEAYNRTVASRARWSSAVC
jgi:hypothetical protein